MRSALGAAALVSCLLAGLWHGDAEAQTRRVSLNLRGDMMMFGNTMAQDCRAAIPGPIVGTFNRAMCGMNIDDTSVDMHWRSDLLTATADLTIAPLQARSTAVMLLPPGASVVNARLYWSGRATAADTTAIIDRPGAFSPITITADSSDTVPNTYYQSSADITSIIQRYGVGPYRVTDVNTEDLRNLNQGNIWQSWTIVVIYQDNRLPARNLTIFDSMAQAQGAGVINATLNGFLVPQAGFDGKLGFVGYEGDFDGGNGDSLIFNGTSLSNAVNPADNILNATRSFLGVLQSVPGDLPQYSGVDGSMNGMDMDTFDVTPQIKAGDTTATIRITSTGEQVIAGIYWTSIATLFPIFSDTNKTWRNLNRNDNSVQPGDVIEYTITTSNTGSDTGTNVTLRDPLPTQLRFVPGSLTVNGQARTDAVADDTFDLTTPGGVQTLIVRLGAGASATQGGTVRVGDPAITIKFRVTVQAGVMGNVLNQAVVSSQGARAVMQGVTETSSWNSGDGKDPAVPTVFAVGLPSDLRVTITDNLNGQVPTPGGNIVYTVTVTNGGPNPVTGASLDHLLPAGAVGATWSCTGNGATCPAAAGAGTINTNMLNLPVNGVVTYTITVPVGVAPLDLVNPTSVITVNPPVGISDPNLANNTARTGVSDLSIRVTDNLNGMPPQAGSPIVYTVTVNNAGPSAAQNIPLSNNLPMGATGTMWTCTAAGGAVCPAANGTGGLPANGGTAPKDGTLTYVVTIPGSATPPADPSYVVSVAAPPPLVDPNLNNNLASTAVSDLQVTVTDNLNNVLPDPNANVQYTIQITNAGPSNARGASLGNMLPTGLTNTSWTCASTGGAMCPAAAGVGAPNVGNLDLPRNGTLTFTVTGQAPAAPAAPWSYTAVVSAPQGATDPNLANNSATASAGVARTDLSIVITKDPTAAKPGEVTTYTAQVSSTGPDTVKNPSVVLTLPPDAMIVMDAAGNGWTCSKNGTTYTCTRPDLAPGDAPPIVAQVTTPAPPAQGGSAPTVIGLVGAPLVNDPQPGNNVAVVDASPVPVRSSDLALTITKSPDPSVLGSDTTYTLQLTNKGPDTALTPVMNFTLPPGSQVKSFMPGAGWTCLQNGLSFSCIRPDAAVGDAPPVVITLTTPAPPDGSQNAGALVGQVSSVQGRDPDPVNNSAAANAGNIPRTSNDLSVRLTRDPQQAQEGRPVTYTLVANNSGPADADNVVVTLQVPPGSKVTSTDFADWNCTQNLNTFVCSRPKLQAGDSPPIKVTVELPPQGPNDVFPGVGGAQATVNGSNNDDPNPANNVVTLDGDKFKLNGGGFSCDCALNSLPGTLPPSSALAGLFFVAYAVSRRLRRRGQAN